MFCPNRTGRDFAAGRTLHVRVKSHEVSDKNNEQRGNSFVLTDALAMETSEAIDDRSSLPTL